MTRNLKYRTAELTRTEGRTVYGLAVPFGAVIDVNDGMGAFRESFAPGSFRRTIAERGTKVKLLDHHNRRSMPIGKASELRESSHGLEASFDVANTQAGDEALELVRAGVIDSFSVGFQAVREHREEDADGEVVVYDEVALFEVSLVSFPAYEGALVAGVRSQPPCAIPTSIAAARLRLLNLTETK